MLYVEETKYFRKLLNAPGNICIPSAFGIQMAVFLCLALIHSKRLVFDRQ